jgi:hypothetical protein
MPAFRISGPQPSKAAVIRMARFRPENSSGWRRRLVRALAALQSDHSRTPNEAMSGASGSAADFAFGVPEGWRPFREAELRRSSHVYGVRVWAGLVSEALPCRSEIVVLSTVGTLSPDWVWPPNGWPGHRPELELVAGPESVTLGGEKAIMSRCVSEQLGVWGGDGWWTPRDSGDQETITMVDVTAGHRAWLYKVLLTATSELAQEHEQSALQTVLASWQWDAVPDAGSERASESSEDLADEPQPLLSVIAWNNQCSAFTFGVPAGWRQLTPRELEETLPLREERVWAAIALDDPQTPARIEVTGHPGHLASVVDGLMHEALAATSSVSLVDGPHPLDIAGRPAASLHYVCLAYDQRPASDAETGDDSQLPDFVSLTLLLAEWDGWVYRIRMYCREHDTPHQIAALSTVLRTWRWERP